MTDIEVHLDTATGTRSVGRARTRRRGGLESTEFTYDESYLADLGWDISPDLPVRTRTSVVEGLPGALDDSAPDRWGRNLIARRLAALARDRGHAAPTPTESDYLLGAHDATRQGALRFRLAEGQPFLAEQADVPHLVDLEQVLAASWQVASGADADEAVALLLEAGSGSLGGARPKTSVVDGSTLLVAKFPHPDDRWDVIRWEAVALDLATRCGLATPTHRLIEIGSHPVLLVERFDRDGDRRIPYLSARSLIGARDGTYDYLELVDGLTEHGSAVASDLVELWDRIAFNVLVNNVDDHMRNHAFLRGSGGWRLSPIFDVNPDPRPAAGRVSAVAGATDAAGCRAALDDVAANFGLAAGEAEHRWDALAAELVSWREVATERGIPGREQDDFAPVLDRWRP